MIAPHSFQTPEKMKYTFLPVDKSQTLSLEKRLLCPQCGELLHRADIEAFSKCPFCNYKFTIGPELEDFILDPIIDEWLKNQHSIEKNAVDPFFF